MNERIKELAEQATKVTEPNDPDYRHEFFDRERFAELIVRECARVSELTGALNQADFEGEMIADAIKEHFGVEE